MTGDPPPDRTPPSAPLAPPGGEDPEPTADPTLRVSSMDLPSATEDESRGRSRRLEWLIGGRIVVTTLFLGGTLLFGIAQGHAFDDVTPRILIALIAATYAVSIGFALELDRPERHGGLSNAQIAWDLALTTGLVYVSGGLASVFTFLYGVVVLLAALTVGPRAALHTTLAAAALVVLGGLPLASGWLPQPADQPAFRYLLGAEDAGLLLMANVVGLTLVGVLSSSLARRLHLAGGALRRATASATEMAMLNDDIVRSLESGLLTTDLEGRVRTVNRAGAAMFGEPARALLGRPVAELLPVTGPPPTSTSGDRGEGTSRRADGTPFPVGFTHSRVLDANGDPMGHLYSYQDLTEVEELRAQAERAERLAALGRLAAGLAHEIRNPLSSIRGSVELVRETAGLGAEEKRLLAIVRGEVERLNELVGTMLQVGRPRAPDRRPTDLAELAREVVDVAARAPAAPRVALALDASPTPPADVDRDQIRQVLWNLLKNAAQVSPRDGKVQVRVHGAGDRVILEVEDEGPGLEEDEVGVVFDTFYSRRPQGIGLGLALVKQIVEAHGGTVEVDSRPGTGATFRVCLTRSVAPSAPPDTSEAPAASPPRSADNADASQGP